MLKANRQFIAVRVCFEMSQQTLDEPVTGSPDHVEARDGVARFVQASLDPIHDREKGDVAFCQPVVDRFARFGDVSFGPAARPDLLFIELAVGYPISQRELGGVADSGSLLFRRAYDEDAAERYSRQPAELVFAVSIEEDDALVVIEQLDGRRESGKPSSDHD